ncbi:MAG TPA: O-antigen ligase family protein [Telluria sp.]|nr:O-antigen ligase family protein [Telluria sp.]
MDELLPYLYASIPFAVVLSLAALAVVGIGVGMVQPRLLVYPYLAIFFMFNSTSYGNLATVSYGSGVYARGSGVLYFALLLWTMLGIWCCARISTNFRGVAAPPCNLRPWFMAWFALLLGHVVVALFVGRKLSEALAPSGFSNIVWMAPLVSLLLLTFRTREHATELARFIVLAGLARALFGLARWAAGGGDPNNVYANMNDIQIKLTFFDVNDSLLCLLAFAIAAVQLFQPEKVKRAAIWIGVEWLTLGATALCIVLSYRRSAWIGFVLALAVLLWRFPLRRRVQLCLFGLPLAAPALAYVAVKRLSQTKGAGQGWTSLLYDMQSRRFGAESERVLELKLALADFLANPLTGIGSWGRYAGYQRISWQTGVEAGHFVHSGILHIGLKTGLVGLALFAGTAWAFVHFARRAFRELPPELLGLATAGAAGMAFMLPDILIGTPFPQVRTSQMMAICLALPYLAMGASNAERAAPAAPAARMRLAPA